MSWFTDLVKWISPAAAIGGAVVNRGQGKKNQGPGGAGAQQGPQGPQVAPGWPGKGGGQAGAAAGPGNVPPKHWFSGQPSYTEYTPIYNEQQGQFQSNTLQNALSMLQQGGLTQPYQFTHNFDFAPIANQARQNFAENTIPSILNRFTSMGGGGARYGALYHQLGKAGANLEADLAAQQAQQGNQFGLGREQLGLQSQQQQRQLFELLSQLGLKPQFDITRNPGQEGTGKEVLKKAVEAAIKALGVAAGGA